MLDSKTELNEFKKKLADNGVSISALSCHGNPLHPDQDRTPNTIRMSARKTIRLAEKLGIPVVIDFSGCPGDCEKSKWPNWVTCPWPPDYLEILKWRWDCQLHAAWTKQGQFAAGDHKRERSPSKCIPACRGVQPETITLESCAAIAGNRRSATITIPATCSGRPSIRSPPSACWAMLSSTVHREDLHRSTQRNLAAL